MRMYVAEHDSQVVGTYILRPNLPGLGSHVANAAFMVSPQVRGLGVGRAMGEHCLRFVLSFAECAELEGLLVFGAALEPHRPVEMLREFGDPKAMAPGGGPSLAGPARPGWAMDCMSELALLTELALCLVEQHGRTPGCVGRGGDVGVEIGVRPLILGRRGRRPQAAHRGEGTDEEGSQHGGDFSTIPGWVRQAGLVRGDPRSRAIPSLQKAGRFTVNLPFHCGPLNGRS